MNYTPETIEALAAEYVLGTLKGAARSRFVTMAMEDRAVREAIWRWEEKLNCQVEGIDPVQPPPEAWNEIASAIEPEDRTRGIGIWQWATAFMLVVSVGLAWQISFGPLKERIVEVPVEVFVEVPVEKTVETGPSSIAMIENQSDEPLWIISFNLESGVLQTRAINAPALELDKAYELWLLVDGTPRSLGLLSVSDEPRRQQISPAVIDLLLKSSGLAVSLEPSGGSPTGLPTGPVLFSGAVHSL